MAKKKKKKKNKKIVKAKPVKSKKQKKIKTCVYGIVNISSSFNNTLVNMADDKGNVLAWCSAGTLGFKGAKKATPFVASQVAKQVVDKCKDFGIKDIDIKVKGVGSGRESAIRTFINAGYNTHSIKDVTRMPHGGVRPKKIRRV